MAITIQRSFTSNRKLNCLVPTKYFNRGFFFFIIYLYLCNFIIKYSVAEYILYCCILITEIVLDKNGLY